MIILLIITNWFSLHLFTRAVLFIDLFSFIVCSLCPLLAWCSFLWFAIATVFMLKWFAFLIFWIRSVVIKFIILSSFIISFGLCSIFFLLQNSINFCELFLVLCWSLCWFLIFLVTWITFTFLTFTHFLINYVLFYLDVENPFLLYFKNTIYWSHIINFILIYTLFK